ncbi:TnsA endonuclease C-terminal domain-containing protein [Nostoc punctiforme]|uniref:Tn7-like transposition protein A n=1 Tax=Nostoc punctiforme (strain ATCC 29133 / PCC 73102) TaxID=63737 RepID=B2J4G7_NOSP7|nr:TnsA endonuclease C-terminal domain-containing protein [Nostoc punctiforme]ACC83657.1 Tn7-like transposition protein A [Nostoc punctiforme PCC 73102]
MLQHKSQKNRKDINKRLNEGCGQGRGINYKPAIWIIDFPSQGFSVQGLGWKTQREHHLFSMSEFRYFYALEWSPIVIDIREQFPLELEETLDIAKQCGYKHPVNPNTGEPNVMTTDFVVTIPGTTGVGITDQARTIKPSRELQNPRVLEKFEIERRYWESHNTSWGIVTEQDIPEVLVKNVEFLHNYFFIENLSPLSKLDIKQITAVLAKDVIQGDVSLSDLAARCDERLALEAGSSLAVARHLIANRQWLIDMNQPLQAQFRKKLALLATPSLKYEINKSC